QYAMAHSGYCWEMAVKVLAGPRNEKVCSSTTARSTSSWTPALQATGKCTSLNCSWNFSRSFLASPFFSWASAETGNRISTGTDSTTNIALRMMELLASALHRSMATALLHAGVREEAASTHLGHVSTQTTCAAYARLSIQTLADEVNPAMASTPGQF